MTRSLNRLTSLKVARAKRPGMYADGGSLYLRVAPGGSKQWIFRYAASTGRMRDMSLGAVHTFSLAEARERATEARKLRADGIDPLDHKRAQRAALRAADAKAMTFEQCARGFIKDNEAQWTNPKHRHEWETTLRKYVSVAWLAAGRGNRYAARAQGGQAAMGAHPHNCVARAGQNSGRARLGHGPSLSFRR
jgi:Arm DNA-binding domain